MPGAGEVSPSIQLRADLEALLAAGDFPGARRAASGLWAAAPNASTARHLIKQKERLWPDGGRGALRIAILRSFTVEPVVPLTTAEGALAGYDLQTWVGEFNAYGQEIFDAQGGLYGHAPDVVILALHTRDIAPVLWRGFAALSTTQAEAAVEDAVATLDQLVTALRARTDARIIVHGLSRPLLPERGALETSAELTQAEAISDVNRGLRRALRRHADVLLLDMSEIEARYGIERFASEKKWASAKLPLSVDAVGWLAHEWWRAISILTGPQAKVLALDLDNTLWGGTVGEDGLNGLKLSDEYPGVFFKTFQKAILDLSRRGVLLAIVSKNNPDDALEVIDRHPDMVLRREHFAEMRINWLPKPDNLRDLAASLNLGLDAFVFVDDNPVECEAVRQALPEVTVIELGSDPSVYADDLRRLASLERLTTTAEDQQRASMYRAEGERRRLVEAAESPEQFLRSLDIRATVAPLDAAGLVRAAQLTQKTNQLNLTTRRYSEAQLKARLEDPGVFAWTLRAADRFGDNGIVGFALAERQDGRLHIDTLLMSCRVIGRGLERAFLSVIADQGRAMGLAGLEGWYLPTAKNPPARMIYANAGFALHTTSGADELWRLSLEAEGPAAPDWITLEIAHTEPA